MPVAFGPEELRQDAQVRLDGDHPSRRAGGRGRRCRARERRHHGVQQRQRQGDAGAAEEAAAGQGTRTVKNGWSSAVSAKSIRRAVSGLPATAAKHLFRLKQRTLHDLVDQRAHSVSAVGRLVQHLLDGRSVGEPDRGAGRIGDQLPDQVPRDGAGIFEQQLLELRRCRRRPAVGQSRRRRRPSGPSVYGTRRPE